MMRMILITVFTIAITTAAWRWEQHQITGLREEQRQLLQTSEEIDRLRTENASWTGGGATAKSLVQPEFSQTELMRLRNEVARGRVNPPDLEGLRQENQRFREELTNALTPPQPLEQMDGYVPKASWKDAGRATPEAAVLSFFAALSQGNIERVLEYLIDEQREEFQDTLNNPTRREGFLNSLRGAAQTDGYRITKNQTTADGTALIDVQGAAGGAVLEIVLRQEGAEWKIEHPFRTAR